MRVKWISFISSRYLFSKFYRSKFIITIFSIIGIALGIAALIIMIGVMNGLQSSYIDNILDISSYHIRIEGDSDYDANLVSSLIADEDIVGVLPFKEIQILVGKDNSDFQGYTVRGIRSDSKKLDPLLFKQLSCVRGNFDLSSKNSLIIGYGASVNMWASAGDSILLTSLSGKNFNILKPSTKEYEVSGVFRCGYAEIENNLIFANIDSMDEDFANVPYVYGVKLKDKYKDINVVERLKKKCDKNIVSWRVYNKSFFNTLKMEKFAMILLLGIIIAIVALNIFYMFKRFVYDKKEDIAVLKALGGNPFDIKKIFLFVGFFIGFIGSSLGLVLGLFVSVNLVYFVSLFEVFFNSILGLPVNLLILKSLPIKIVFKEVLFFYVYGVLASFFSAYFAVRRVSKIKTAQIIRYE